MASFADLIKQGIEINKLNPKAITAVANDKKATGWALLIVVLAGVAAGIGTLNPIGIILFPIVYLAEIFISIGIMHLLALLFGGKVTYMDYLRPMAVGYVIMWVMVVPIIGPIVGGLASLWYLVVNVVVLKTVHKLSTGKAVVIVLVPVIIALILAVMLGIAIAAIFLAAGNGILKQ